MARLSDFQLKPTTKIEQNTLDVMERNAKAAGFRGNWRATEIRVPKVRGGELYFHQNPFKEAEAVAEACIAMDTEQHLRRAAHVALDSALDDDDEPEEENEDEELDSRSEQQKHGGGCGRSYGCDAGSLGGTDEFRGSARRGRCGCCAACTRRNAVV
jgi:hypothetical protein